MASYHRRHPRRAADAGERWLARRVAAPIQRFLEVEAAGGILLVVAAAVALVWANSPGADAYRDLWSTEVDLELAGVHLPHDIRHWVNDGLMALFFLVIGLEIKQELVAGQLRSIRQAAVPAAGALGGMVVPALLYAAVNAGGEGSAGWGIPMATDVAFAVGVLSLLGSRVPGELKVLLLGLAIVDDIGAIVVIAAFYSSGLHAGWALAALAGLALVAAGPRLGVRSYLPYVVVGTGVWFATLASGVHATIAGVALGLLAPTRPAPEAGSGDETAGGAFAVAEPLRDALHPWTSYLIVPLFALANAGVAVSADGLRDAVTSPIAIGVVVGLVVGKLVGVAAAIGLVTRIGWGRLPDAVGTRHVVGLAAVAGIGFTVSIFVTGLAFDREALADEAKLGVLAASLVAALLGAAVLRRRGDEVGSGAES